MAVRTDMREILDVKKLPTFPNLRVIGIEAEDYTDWTGDDSLRVTVTLDESVDIEKVTGKEAGDFKMAIRQSLRDHGITLFAYIFLQKPSDLTETDDEE